MKIIKERFDHFSISYPLEKIASLEKILFIDIETTGFTARSSYLYMIGCAYYQEGNWHTIQWMAENYEQEADILTAFFQFAENFECLIHFNGNVFDLPYMTQKCVKFSLPYTFDRLTGIDLYRRISPYKAILNLPNCKQKTMEDFLGIDREDTYNGKELISFYQEYVNHPNEQTLHTLLLHNRDDLRGMLQLLSMLSYYDLFTEQIRARKVQANSYKDLDGNQRRELLMTLVVPVGLPKPISFCANGCYLHGDPDNVTLRVPIYDEELKYFYSNYKDYYYLPEEDVALHKSVSSFVDKEHRQQAHASNCYTRKTSAYLQQWDALFTPLFKRKYDGKEVFFELTDEMKKDRDAFAKYATHVLSMLVANQPN